MKVGLASVVMSQSAIQNATKVSVLIKIPVSVMMAGKGLSVPMPFAQTVKMVTALLLKYAIVIMAGFWKTAQSLFILLIVYMGQLLV